MDKEQLEEDFETLGQISELSQKLKVPHQVVRTPSAVTVSFFVSLVFLFF